MKKRETNKTEERLLSHIEVSSGVLDSARKELAEKRREKEALRGAAAPRPPRVTRAGAGGAAARALSRSAAIVVAACLIAALAIAAAVFCLPKKNSGEEPVYALSQLTRRDIGSIASYNAENGAEYLCAADGATDACAYSDGGRDVLLCENFGFGGLDCVWYVLTDSYGKNVDILLPFYECQNSAAINEQEVFYDGDEFDAAYFYRGGAAYFLSINEGGQQTLEAVLEYLIRR